MIIQGNEAAKSGGGIHAISSLIMLSAPLLSAQAKWIELIENTAVKGDGIMLESNAKVYIYQYNGNFYRCRISNYSILFRMNSAKFGGGIYVDDYLNSAACNSTLYSPTSECFLQVLSHHLNSNKYLYTKHIEFLDNHTSKSGPILYGGLLDRCTISPFAEINRKVGEESPKGGLFYFQYIIISSITNYDLASVSSSPVRVCPCINGLTQWNCSHTLDIKVKKDHPFNIIISHRG